MLFYTKIMQTESRTIKLAWNCYAEVQLTLCKDNAKTAICGTRNWLKFNGYANGGQDCAANVVRYFVHFVMPGVGGISHVTSGFVGYRR